MTGTEQGKNTFSGPCTALLLAGSRPETDMLARAGGVAAKALLPVAGKPMISHVLTTLLASQEVGQVGILAQQPQMFAEEPGTAILVNAEQVKLITSEATIASSITAVIEQQQLDFPMLVTTADNVLLTLEMVADFCTAASGQDLAIGVVEKDVLLRRYPGNKRTWLKLRGGQYSGANLFYLGSRRALTMLRYWAAVEQDRKKGWKILTIFGPALLLMALLRLLTIHQLAAKVGAKLGLSAKIVEMPQAEACIDVDKTADLELAEKILAARAEQLSASD